MIHPSLFSLLAALAAMLSVGMWIDYFRNIDVFEREKTWPLIIALLIGGLAPFLSLSIYRLLDTAGYNENGEVLNDLFYAVFCIGLNEEVSKLLAVFIVFRVLKKYINEPVDFLIYAGVTALGFAVVENYRYFINHGVNILSSRTFYSALEHIINTTIIVYGFYRFQLFGKGQPLVNAVVAFSIAVASHGLFDFFLSLPEYSKIAVFGSVIVYLIGINFWAQMLNNANNFSKFFKYDQTSASSSLVLPLFIWYAATLVLTFVVNALFHGASTAVPELIRSVFSDGLLFFVVIIRVSRFQIVQGLYLPVKLQLPIYVSKHGDEDIRLPIFKIPIKVRGENFREHFLTRAVTHDLFLVPLDASNNNGLALQVHLQQKLLLQDDQVLYRITMETVPPQKQRVYFLKTITSLMKVHQADDEVCGLYFLETNDGVLDPSVLAVSKLTFVDWYKVGDISNI